MAQSLKQKVDELAGKLKELVDAIEAKYSELEEAKNALVDGMPDKKRESAEKKIAKLTEQHKKLVETHAKKNREFLDLERKLRLQELLSEQAKLNVKIRDIQLEALSDAEKDIGEDSLRNFVAKARVVQRAQDALSVLKEPLDEAREFLREFVMAHPSGLIADPNPYKRYRFTRYGKIMVILQDGVTYEIPLKQLLELVSLQYLKDLNLLQVDFVAMVELIKAGKFMITDKNTHEVRAMKLEEWEAMRERRLKSPSVVVREEDAVGDEKVVVFDPRLISLPIDRLPEFTKLTGHHLHPLKTIGLQIVAELKGMSVLDLIDIPGIGQKRATEIIDEITKNLAN